MDAIKENWTTIKEAVRREYSLSDISYHTWVEPLEFHNVVNDVVSIIIPSDQAHAPVSYTHLTLPTNREV